MTLVFAHPVWTTLWVFGIFAFIFRIVNLFRGGPPLLGGSGYNERSVLDAAKLGTNACVRFVEENRTASPETMIIAFNKMGDSAYVKHESGTPVIGISLFEIIKNENGDILRAKNSKGKS